MVEVLGPEVLYTNDKLPSPIICSELIDYVPPGLVEVVRSGYRSLELHKEKVPSFFRVVES